MKRSRRQLLRESGQLTAALLSGALPSVNAGLSAGISNWLGTSPPIPGKDFDGSFVGQQFERGHRLRSSDPLPAPSTFRATDVLIIGSGIAGLSAARALVRSGIEDFRILELEDEAGGNSRGESIAGMACPLGAHYLPVPGPHASEVAELLNELGLRRETHGQVSYDEQTLCHSPQERLYINGHWQDGLLPVLGQDEATFAEYRRFADLISKAMAAEAYAIPTARSQWNAELTALDQITFAQWLDSQHLITPTLRWYLDYCCRDDYGAGIERVSAWAGLHYFASRHGFSAPGNASEPDRDFETDGILTWPEGNAWLSRRLAAPIAERIIRGHLALRVNTLKAQVEVDVRDCTSGTMQRWSAKQVILATPLFISARLLSQPSDALREIAARQQHAPWLVANVFIDRPLRETNGSAPLSWDNVLFGDTSLGYVNAMNQSTRSYPGPTILSAYLAFGDDPASGRQQLLQRSWSDWCQQILRNLATAHPDLPGKVKKIDIMRYGHAMAIPTPGLRSSAALSQLHHPEGLVAFAHSDLSSYSIFEEAFYWGHTAGQWTADRLRRSS